MAAASSFGILHKCMCMNVCMYVCMYVCVRACKHACPTKWLLLPIYLPVRLSICLVYVCAQPLLAHPLLNGILYEVISALTMPHNDELQPRTAGFRAQPECTSAARCLLHTASVCIYTVSELDTACMHVPYIHTYTHTFIHLCMYTSRALYAYMYCMCTI
jgi:hypothetical protein